MWHGLCCVHGQHTGDGAWRACPFQEADMLQTLVIILVVLWLLGMVSSYTLGGFLHVLLVVALILLIVRLASGRKVV